MSKEDKALNLMVYTNLSQREIAKKLDVREETVSRWKQKEEFQAKKKDLQEEFLKDLTSPAIRTMKELLNANSDYVRFQAAQDILDRTGYKANEKLDMSIDMPTIISGDDELSD